MYGREGNCRYRRRCFFFLCVVPLSVRLMQRTARRVCDGHVTKTKGETKTKRKTHKQTLVEPNKQTILGFYASCRNHFVCQTEYRIADVERSSDCIYNKLKLETAGVRDFSTLEMLGEGQTDGESTQTNKIRNGVFFVFLSYSHLFICSHDIRNRIYSTASDTVDRTTQRTV